MLPGVNSGKRMFSLFLQIQQSRGAGVFCLFGPQERRVPCCSLAIAGGAVSADVWPDLPAAPGAVHGALPKSCPKDALPGSKPNKPAPPSTPHCRGHTEVRKVNETVEQEPSPAPQKAAPEGHSKSEPLEAKDAVREERDSQVPICLHRASTLAVRSRTSLCSLRPRRF